MIKSRRRTSSFTSSLNQYPKTTSSKATTTSATTTTTTNGNPNSAGTQAAKLKKPLSKPAWDVSNNVLFWYPFPGFKILYDPKIKLDVKFILGILFRD